MLLELRVSQLVVVEDLAVVFAPGMTALTGETGAGKTLVVEALQLLHGGRADPSLVRPGAPEAVVEGRFTYHGPDGEREVVLKRVVPAEGRSRAYIDGGMVTLAALAEMGQQLVELHGQHAHQSLFSGVAQREALDYFAGVDDTRRRAARAEVRAVEDLMSEAGGDQGARAREMEFLRYQLGELGGAAVAGPDEDALLAAEEEQLSGAASHRAVAWSAYESLTGDGGVADRLGEVEAAVAGHPPLADVQGRLRSLSAELADVAVSLRTTAEGLEDDPRRLAQVEERLALLRDLKRKYAGPGGDLAAVLAFLGGAAERLRYLEDLENVAADLGRRHQAAMAELLSAGAEVGAARRAAAGKLGEAVQTELQRLAMPRATFEVAVGGSGDSHDLAEQAGDQVSFQLAANPGEPRQPLAKVASGGELARAMLALRLVLLGQSRGAGSGPHTLVFDEVDAGIGGEAAVAVGHALAELGGTHQVLVVTHLAQVAAFAQSQVAVSKVEQGGRSRAFAVAVRGEDRVIELSRMLSGQPDSATAREHARELLQGASDRPPPVSAA